MVYAAKGVGEGVGGNLLYPGEGAWRLRERERTTRASSRGCLFGYSVRGRDGLFLGVALDIEAISIRSHKAVLWARCKHARLREPESEPASKVDDAMRLQVVQMNHGIGTRPSNCSRSLEVARTSPDQTLATMPGVGVCLFEFSACLSRTGQGKSRQGKGTGRQGQHCLSATGHCSTSANPAPPQGPLPLPPRRVPAWWGSHVPIQGLELVG